MFDGRVIAGGASSATVAATKSVFKTVAGLNDANVGVAFASTTVPSVMIFAIGALSVVREEAMVGVLSATRLAGGVAILARSIDGATMDGRVIAGGDGSVAAAVATKSVFKTVAGLNEANVGVVFGFTPRLSVVTFANAAASAGCEEVTVGMVSVTRLEAGVARLARSSDGDPFNVRVIATCPGSPADATKSVFKTGADAKALNVGVAFGSAPMLSAVIFVVAAPFVTREEAGVRGVSVTRLEAGVTRLATRAVFRTWGNSLSAAPVVA